jgi:haloalkane dehalogenase
MRDARSCDDLYGQISGLLASSFAFRPLLTIFGELNDPFGFQQKWKDTFLNATQIIVPKAHHFPMCDAPDLVAQTIHSWHREHVALGLI